LTDLEKARELLKTGNFGSCVLYSEHIIHTGKGKGIAPMMEFLAAGLDMKGFAAADVIAGKAAALLFALAGVNAVYADVMSKTAVEVFGRFGIRCVYGELVDYIKNRDETGMCPMEQAVLNTNDPQEAFEILNRCVRQSQFPRFL